MTSYLAAAAGGVLIGLAALWLLLALGRVAGISGITWGLITRKPDWLWRALFLFGLVLGVAGYHWVTGTAQPELTAGFIPAALAGLIVGIGVKLGNGCTSGHGVCGIARRSMRSLTATIIFMATGIITVAVTRHLL
jgi:uncharacterized membrane protein YedE/YeeE